MLGATLLVGCASTQQQTKTAVDFTERELPVDRQLARRIFDGQAPLVFKYRPGRWATARDVLTRYLPVQRDSDDARRTNRVSPSKMLRTLVEGRVPRRGINLLLEELERRGPVAVLAGSLGLDELASRIDENRTMYLRVDWAGAERARWTGRLGLPPMEADASPTGLHYRLLVPVDDPMPVAERIRNVVGRLSDESDDVSWRATVTPLESRIQVDLLHAYSFISNERIDRTLEAITPQRPDGAIPKPTPAMHRFLEDEGTAAVYTDLEALRSFAFVEITASGRSALGNVRAEQWAYAMARSQRGSFVFGLLNPTLEQTFADATLKFQAEKPESAKKAGHLTAELAASRNRLGRKRYERTSDPVSAPTFDDSAFEGKNPVFRATIATNVDDVGQTTSGVDVFSSSKPREEPLIELDEALRLTDGWGYLSPLASPEHSLRIASSVLRSRAGFPLPRSLAVRLATSSSGSGAPMSGGLALLFDADSREWSRIRASLGRLANRWSELTPFDLDTSFAPENERLYRATFGLDVPAEALSTEKSRERKPGIAAGGNVSNGLEVLEKLLPHTERGSLRRSIDDGTRIRLRTAHSKFERRIRLTTEPNQAELTAARGGSVRRRPGTPRCLSRLRVRVLELFNRLEETEWTEKNRVPLLDKYDELVRRCEGLSKERRNWARGRWRVFIAENFENLIRDRTRRLARCAGIGPLASSTDDFDNTHACRELRPNPLSYLDKTHDLVDFTDGLYRKACELGDEAGCRAPEAERRELPSAETLRKKFESATESSESE